MKAKLILICSLFSLVSSEVFKYPDVKRQDNVVDDYYGVKVNDPYRWLEEPDTKEVQNFVDEQNKLTETYINGPGSMIKDIEKDLTSVYNYPKYGVPRKYGSHYYYFSNTGLQNQDVFYVQDSLEGEPRVFLDPNTLSTDGTAAISDIEFSEDGNLLAYGVSRSGSDWNTISIKNVTTGEDFPESLTRVKFSAIAWTHDNLGFFYGRYPDEDTNSTQAADGTETTKNTNQKIYYHRVGTKQTDDVLVVEFVEHPKYLIAGGIQVSSNGRYLIFFPHDGAAGETLVYYVDLNGPLARGINSKLEIVGVIKELTNDYDYITSDGSVLYFKTNRKAPNFKIIGIDLNKPEEQYWTTLVPEHTTDVIRFAKVVNQNKLIVGYLSDVKSKLEVRFLGNGSLINNVPLDVGSIESYSGDKDDTEFFFKFVSFISPGIIYRIDFTQEHFVAKVFREVKVAGFEPKNFVTEQVFYTSKDGTKIPMFIVHKKDYVRNGNSPTLLYAYGGFTISILPSFKPDRIVFIRNFDGVLAIPNIRGGGEYGQKWHEQGRLLNKQNVFDDFQYAAEYLITSNYTSPANLVIQGGSNGGLLIGACVNQRPELFGAGIGQVGVMDLLRFQKFTIGYAWCPEYGCSDDGDKSHFDNLLKLSPLHNVRMPKNESVQYPAVLLMTADHDDRVVPLHSYKLISELQHTIGSNPRQTNPLMIRVQTNAGHGAGKPTSKKISETAELYAFLIHALKFKYHSG
jgi:prolyl oligopeptidase